MTHLTQGVMIYRAFAEKVESKQATVAVIGLGYVGLPLAVALAESGLTTTGLDIDHEKVDRLRRGLSYVLDRSEERRVGKECRL